MNDNWKSAEILARKILICAVFALAVGLLLFFLPIAISLLAPFIVAYIIMMIASPLTKLLLKIKLPRSLCAVISIIVVALLLFTVIGAVVWKIGSEIYGFSASLPEMYQSTAQALDKAHNFIIDIPNLLPFEIAPYVADLTDKLGDAISSLSSTVVSVLTTAALNIASGVPTILISIIFSILAAFFMMGDDGKIKNGIKKLLGANLSGKIHTIKFDLSQALLGYLRAQGILMCITFVENFIGLSILGIKYSFLIAILIAFIDAIPVFGSGTVLIPWAVVSLITGNYTRAIGLLIIYGVCLLVRQFLEPKILSHQIGMHPLLTLIAIYVGFRLFGVAGMILGPVVTILGKNFLDRLLANRSDKSVNHLK